MFQPLLTAGQLQDLDIEKYQSIVSKLAIIDRESIDDELATVAVVFSYYYGLLVRSKRILDDSKTRLDHWKAKLGVDSRSTADKKLTAKNLEDIIMANDDISSLTTDIDRNEEIYSYMKGICSTLEQRKDMLVQLSANKRQETKLYN